MTIKYVQAQTFSLAGAGVSIGNSSMIVDNFNQIDGTPLTMTDFGIKGYGTVEPGSGVNEEQISWSGVVINGDGTSTLTGINSVLDVYPYTETANFSSDHAGGVAFVISNTAGFYGNFGNKLNDELITGVWGTSNVPANPTDYTNKAYVDAIAIAGAPNATTVLQGLVQLATQAQIDAKTAIGSTGASLTITPDKLRATKYNDYVTDTGSVNTYVITPSPAETAYVTGQEFTWKVSNTNTSSSPTLNVNALGAKTLVNPDGSSINAGQLPSGSIVKTVYDGTNMQVLTISKVGPLFPYTVNADENVTVAITNELPLGTTGTGITIYNNGFTLVSAPGVGGIQIQKSLLDANAGNLQFSYAHPIRLKWSGSIGAVTSGTPPNYSSNAFGFSDIGTDLTDPTSSTSNSIKLCQSSNLNSGDIFLVTSNGVSNTHTDLSAFVTPGTSYVWEIIWTPGVSVVLKIGGTTVVTQTTNIPNGAVTAKLWYSNQNAASGSNGGIAFTTPVFSVRNS